MPRCGVSNIATIMALGFNDSRVLCNAPVCPSDVVMPRAGQAIASPTSAAANDARVAAFLNFCWKMLGFRGQFLAEICLNLIEVGRSLGPLLLTSLARTNQTQSRPSADVNRRTEQPCPVGSQADGQEQTTKYHWSLVFAGPGLAWRGAGPRCAAGALKPASTQRGFRGPAAWSL